MYRLARIVQKQVDRLERQGKLGDLPPVTAFQSVVDSTVINTALVTEFYDKLVPNHSELVLFDVNQHLHVKHFIKERYRTNLLGIEQTESLPYTLTIITNEHELSLNVIAKTKPAGATRFEPSVPLHLAWPDDAYSLSHVALLFPPEDPVYGMIDTRANPESFKLGALEPRGETTVLNVSLEHLMRIRSNPFFPYLEQRIIEAISGTHRNSLVE
jgi:hypothetical protein